MKRKRRQGAALQSRSRVRFRSERLVFQQLPDEMREFRELREIDARPLSPRWLTSQRERYGPWLQLQGNLNFRANKPER